MPELFFFLKSHPPPLSPTPPTAPVCCWDDDRGYLQLQLHRLHVPQSGGWRDEQRASSCQGRALTRFLPDTSDRQDVAKVKINFVANIRVMQGSCLVTHWPFSLWKFPHLSADILCEIVSLQLLSQWRHFVCNKLFTKTEPSRTCLNVFRNCLYHYPPPHNLPACVYPDIRTLSVVMSRVQRSAMAQLRGNDQRIDRRMMHTGTNLSLKYGHDGFCSPIFVIY